MAQCHAHSHYQSNLIPIALAVGVDASCQLPVASGKDYLTCTTQKCAIEAANQMKCNETCRAHTHSDTLQPRPTQPPSGRQECTAKTPTCNFVQNFQRESFDFGQLQLRLQYFAILCHCHLLNVNAISIVPPKHTLRFGHPPNKCCRQHKSHFTRFCRNTSCQ